MYKPSPESEHRTDFRGDICHPGYVSCETPENQANATWKWGVRKLRHHRNMRTERTTTATHWVAVVPREIGRGLLSRFGCSRRLAQLLGRIERRGCTERRRPEEPGRIALLTRTGRR